MSAGSDQETADEVAKGCIMALVLTVCLCTIIFTLAAAVRWAT